MKKIISILALALIVMTANAETRKWDFTNWSAATIANLAAGAGQVSPSSNWSDIEKSSGTAPTDLSKENCYWEVSAQGNATSGTTIQANGQDIAELSGLLYTNTTARSLAIAINYQNASSTDAAFQGYKGPSYLWLGSSKKNYFVIPNVKAGSKIKMGVESHKNTDARGVNLYVVKKGAYSTLGSALKDPDGNAVSTPTTYVDQTFLLNEDILTDDDKAMANEDGTYDVMIYNTNGCHLYYITVSSEADVAKTLNVGYVYGGDISSDVAYMLLASDSRFAFTEIPSSAALPDTIRNFDAVFVAPTVKVSDAIVPALAKEIAYVPMVTTGSAINSTLSLTSKEISATSAFTPADATSELWTNTDPTAAFFVDGTLPVWSGMEATALATVGDDAVIYQQYASRNSHIYLPMTEDNVNVANWDNLGMLIPNTITIVAATKKDVTACATPSISLTYADQKTTATITCATSGSVIEYSLDGTSYQAYTAPVEFTTAGTIYAKATAVGYTASDVAQKDVDIQHQTATPQIAVDGETFSITGEGTIYYNITGSEETAKSAIYSDPVTVPFSCTVTAFAIDGNNLQSNSAQAAVTSSDKYGKELCHLNFKETWTNDQTQATVAKATLNKKYLFFWDGDDTTKDSYPNAMTIKNAAGADSTAYYRDSVMTYSLYADGNNWTVRTNGANMAFSTDGNEGVICVEGGSTAYGAADVFSASLYTKNAFTFGELGHTRDAEYVKPSITSGQKYQAPFKITALITGALGSGTCQSPAYKIDDIVVKQRMEVLVSADGTNYNVIDTIGTTTDKMSEAVSTVYNGTDEVYVQLRAIMQEGNASSSNRKINLNDLYIYAEGSSVGIENVTAAAEAQKATDNRRYNISGQQVGADYRGLVIMNGKKYVVK